jgi:hypothetical protein
MTFPVKAPNFQPMSWADRVKAWLQYRPSLEQEFLSANRDAIRRCVGHGESGLRMVVNIPADGLLGFLADGRYKNAYELPFVAGAERQPSTTRQQVDKLIQLVPPKDYYFGAIALGGTGIRFYGEYCLSLLFVLLDQLIRQKGATSARRKASVVIEQTLGDKVRRAVLVA